MIEFRKYQIGDEKYILELYKKVFKRELSYKTWEWKYNGLNSDRKLIFLAFDGINCVGHYALMPFKINAYGKDVDSFISLDSMVHPEFQGQKVFSQLVNYSSKQIEGINKPYITFLNEQSISIYTKKYNWKYLGNIPVYCRPLSLNYLKTRNKLVYFFIKPFALLINSFNKKINKISLQAFNQFNKEILSLSRDSRFYSINRSKEFFDWRFDKAPFTYEKYKILYDQNLIGYCVIRIERKFGLNFVWIMDIFINKEYENQYANVLNIIAMKNMYTSDFITSLLPSKKYTKYYYKSGYIKIPQFIFPHNFYFCINKNKYENEDIYNLNNWYFSWSLNDVL